MPKVKKEPFSKEKHDRLFYYEIIGFFLTFFSFLALAKLGTLGLYLNLLIRFLTGDWYFLFVFLGIGIGIYFLLMHQKIPLSNLLLLGFFLIILSLMILSHFSMHKFVIQYEGNSLSLTLSLYLDYFKNKNSTSMVGGGVIGMLFFYLFFYLLSTPGVIIICLCMLLLGITFLSKKTIFELFGCGGKIFKKILVIFKKAFGKVRNGIESIDEEYQNRHKKRLPRDIINRTYHDYSADIKIFSDGYLKKIKEAMANLSIYKVNVDKIVTPHLLIFKLSFSFVFEKYLLETLLKKAINMPFLLRYDEINNIVYVEINNPYARYLTFKDLICDNDEVLLGIDDRNTACFFDNDNNAALLWDIQKSYFIFLAFSFSYFHQNVMIYDMAENVQCLEDYFPYSNNFDELSKYIDSLNSNKNNLRLNILITYDKDNKDLIDKIRCLLSLTKGTKIRIIVCLDEFIKTDLYFYEVFNYLINLDNGKKEVLKLFDFDSDYGLNIGKEALFKQNDLIIRIAVGIINPKEIEKKQL